jgi:hypothetical protein
MTLLRVWFIGTLIFLGGIMTWAFAPILVLIFAITAGLGILVLMIVAAARRLERSRRGP